MKDFLLMLGVVVFWLVMQGFVLPAFGIGVCLNPKREPMTREQILARYGVKSRAVGSESARPAVVPAADQPR